MNIYEQAVEQAKIDNQQKKLDRLVEFQQLKNREALLLERLDSLGVKYQRNEHYYSSEDDFLDRYRVDIVYDIYLYNEKVLNRTEGKIGYPVKKLKIDTRGKYKLGNQDYSPIYNDVNNLIEAVAEDIMRTTKYYTNN